MKKFINRYRIWKLWSAESKFFKILVLFNLAECLAFENFRVCHVIRERLNAMNKFVQHFTKPDKELDELEKEE